jgi:hypothetical protein
VPFASESSAHILKGIVKRSVVIFEEPPMTFRSREDSRCARRRAGNGAVAEDPWKSAKSA